MGNKTSHLAVKGPSGPRVKSHIAVENIPDSQRSSNRQNHIAREILEQNVPDRVPSNDEMMVALAIQQTTVTGNLKKTDLIAILIRLNPKRDNALISQFTIGDLNNLIRHELYTVPLQAASSKLEVAHTVHI